MVKTLTFNAGSVGSVPGLGAKIPHASWSKKHQNRKQTILYKFNKDGSLEIYPSRLSLNLLLKRFSFSFVGQSCVS